MRAIFPTDVLNMVHTMATNRRVRPGEVMEIDVPGGRCYGQYIGEHPSLGGTLFIDPTIRGDPLEDATEFTGAAGYYMFYPVRAAIRAGFIRAVGGAPMHGRRVPDRVRRHGAITATGQVLNWVIVDGERTRVVERLDRDQLRLPIGGIWNHAMLIHRILEGWSPEADGRLTS